MITIRCGHLLWSTAWKFGNVSFRAPTHENLFLSSPVEFTCVVLPIHHFSIMPKLFIFKTISLNTCDLRRRRLFHEVKQRCQIYLT
jgi:hypothetical protein